MRGQFVGRGVSPFNNSALQAVMYATLDGYRVGWPMGADKMLLISLDTGLRNPSVTPSSITVGHAVQALSALMDHCAASVETLLQWMSSSPSARTIDRELAHLCHDIIGQMPLLSYLRYHVELEADSLKNDLGLELPNEQSLTLECNGCSREHANSKKMGISWVRKKFMQMISRRCSTSLLSPFQRIALRRNQMAIRQKYKKIQDSFVTAIQLDFDTEGFTYNKWGGKQVVQKGDWLVDNDGDKYTVEEESFAKTYERISPGMYRKSAPVWAEVATEPGKIRTKEGDTSYNPGDYLVYNDEQGTDGYAIAAEKFKSMYERIEK